jgi:hypothetical protein
MANVDRRSSWLTDRSPIPGVPGTWKPYTGVLETVQGQGMTINCGSAVGGGSLTYHGMTLQPAQVPSTWHALGGVPMGGAVDRHGRVLGHRGLYVLDGARIPGSTGACNPSMTIAALAEHSMAAIVRSDIGRLLIPPARPPAGEGLVSQA